MESASYMQSVLSPNTPSAVYASTGYRSQGPQQTNGSSNALSAGLKRDYEIAGDDANGLNRPYQRPPPLNLNNGGRIDDTPSRDESQRRDSSTASPGGEHQKKKQKRNKPTLSCFECVERKTKACVILPCVVPTLPCLGALVAASAAVVCLGRRSLLASDLCP